MEADIQRRIVRLVRGGPIKYLERGRYTLRSSKEFDGTLIQLVDWETRLRWNVSVKHGDRDDNILESLHYALHTLSGPFDRLYYRGAIFNNTLDADDIEFINNNLELVSRLLAFEEAKLVRVESTIYGKYTQLI